MAEETSLNLIQDIHNHVTALLVTHPDKAFYVLSDDILQELPEELRLFYSILDPVYVFTISSLMLKYFYSTYGIAAADADVVLSETELAEFLQADIKNIFSPSGE